MTTTRKTVLGLGEVLWDIDRLRGTRTPGGAPINFAFYAARRGLRGIAVSAVGQDAAGDKLLEACRSHGIETEIARVDAPTGSAVAYLEAGEQRFRIEEEVAYDRIPCTERMLELARTAAAAAFGTLAQRCAPSRDTIRRLLAAMPAEALRLYDINLRPPFYGRETVEASLEIADALKINDEELVVLQRMFDLPADEAAAVEALAARWGLRLVVLTAGARYSRVHTPEAVSLLPTPRVEIREGENDTVGAGDAFTGTLVAELLLGRPIAEAHRTAVETAAEVCRHRGAWI